MHHQESGRVLTALLLVLAVQSGCARVPDSVAPPGAVGSAAADAAPRALVPGDGTQPAPYLISIGVPEQRAVAVVDARTLTIVANILDSDPNGLRNVRFTSY